MKAWIAAVGMVLLAACGGGPGQAAGFRVALITPGSIADAAWNAGAYDGLMQIRESMGVIVSHIEARTPAEQEEALRTYAAQGYPLIFAHGFEFQDMAERVAADYPDAIIAITSGQRVVGNVVPLIFRLREPSYLAGMVAAAVSKSGRIGFVGGIELPPVRMGYEAWVNGARSINPNIDARSTYLNNFDDAVAGREAAIALIRTGVDVLSHNADAAGLGVFRAATEFPGVYVIGSNKDQRSLAPDRVLGSAVIDLPRSFLLLAQEVKEGRFVPREESFGLDSGVLSWVPNPALDSLLPSGFAARLAAAADSIKAGTLIAVRAPPR
ncbi:MAG: BMP family protein [Gemmatimonadota bacterium]|nr:BMP family protein [Gemmatimonadota bacterium]